MIISTRSSESNTDDILICIWEYEEKKSKQKIKKSITFWNVLVVLSQIILLACTSMFLLQNKVSIICIMNIN